MAEPADLLNAAQGAIREVADTAKSLVSDSTGVASDVLGPLQRQAELLERIIQRQLVFERDLVSQIVAPARATLEVAEQATAAWHQQASAFRAASASFAELADLTEGQAKLVEQTTAILHDALAALRSATEKITGDNEDK